MLIISRIWGFWTSDAGGGPVGAGGLIVHPALTTHVVEVK